jgi:hypothetical protein
MLIVTGRNTCRTRCFHHQAETQHQTKQIASRDELSAAAGTKRSLEQPPHCSANSVVTARRSRLWRNYPERTERALFGSSPNSYQLDVSRSDSVDIFGNDSAGLRVEAHPGVGSENLGQGLDLRRYRTIIKARAAGSLSVMASFLYKLIAQFAQFLVLRPRADIDKDVEILVLRHR